MARIKCLLEFDTDTKEYQIVNTETGEIIPVSNIIKSTSKKSSTSSKKVKVDDSDPTPKITLESNKYCMNLAAAKCLLNYDDEGNIVADQRIDIKYEKNGKSVIPIIGNDEMFGTHQGNKVTKTCTVSYRGKANEELAKYGTEFTLTPHPTKSGLFILNGNMTPVELVGDDNISIPDEDQSSSSNEDIDFDDLVEVSDDNNDTEINDFNFTL